MSRGLWVQSEWLPDGTYVVGLSIGDDRAWTLDRDQALAYTVTCVQRATEAEHDAAVLRLLTDKGIPLRTAAEIMARDIRPDRPTDDTATAPLVFVPGIAEEGLQPFLVLHLDGEPVSQFTPTSLRTHALAVLRVLAAVDLDAALRRVLVGPVGLDASQAAAMIYDLQNYWPAAEVVQ